MSNLALDFIASRRIRFCPIKMSWAHYQHDKGLREMAARLIAGNY